ncbi:succinate dehydrogenase, hydrophobic membrane anchor protein [Anaplasma capra]|uniref:succinate dehydrogenase, hydrophobic membrane anchor protein n=1 Tax=Anaplasma capra TaxID=1562740 RepID=UPI0021D57DC3|nr:succinate dehydrogenase, hydrophobic membrane anchor protein [Anaplasma capra]MCU7611354.1 succinate dehydrogenase, hydrophobic membrane anchor protein [Anaplasma capra]MCU7612428.1 succinate dehydrogenase, hydrophobic membrane anchor protein [Anaplasma capra]
MGGRSVHFWWMQRIAGLVMLPLPFFFVVLFRTLDLESVHTLRYGFCASLFAVTFLVAALYHGVLGVQVVLEDYVRSGILRASLVTFCKLFAVFTVLSVVFAIFFGSAV